MPAQLTRAQKRFFTKPNIGHLATLMKDGSPQSTPVWVDLEGERILVKTTDDQQKTANIHGIRVSPFRSSAATTRIKPATSGAE
jgi:hypothetical protein